MLTTQIFAIMLSKENETTNNLQCMDARYAYSVGVEPLCTVLRKPQTGNWYSQGHKFPVVPPATAQLLQRLLPEAWKKELPNWICLPFPFHEYVCMLRNSTSLSMMFDCISESKLSCHTLHIQPLWTGRLFDREPKNQLFSHDSEPLLFSLHSHSRFYQVTAFKEVSW